MFLPDVNIKKNASWYKDEDIPSLSIDDSQVSGGSDAVDEQQPTSSHPPAATHQQPHTSSHPHATARPHPLTCVPPLPRRSSSAVASC